MKSSTKDQAEGKFHKVKGKIKEVAGKLSDNLKLQAEGTKVPLKRFPAKFRKRSARSRRFWVSKQWDADGMNNFFINTSE